MKRMNVKDIPLLGYVELYVISIPCRTRVSYKEFISGFGVLGVAISAAILPAC